MDLEAVLSPPALENGLFGLWICLPMATELPMWGPGTSVRRRFSCSSRTSRCLPVSCYVGCRSLKHNGGSRNYAIAAWPCPVLGLL